MEKYLVPVNPTADKPKSVRSRPWKRSLIELNGKFEPSYRHNLSSLIIQSYSEVGAFPHKYHVNGEPCQTHGVYLASVTKSGCLTVHDFDAIQNPGEDETKQLLHISTWQQLDVVRWNLANQDEVACTSTKSSEVHIYDIGYISSEPVERIGTWNLNNQKLKKAFGVLRKRPNISVHGFNVHKGFSDIAFSSDDNSRLLASDTNGVINVWDRRVSDLPCLELRSSSIGSLNSIKLSGDNEEEHIMLLGTIKRYWLLVKAKDYCFPLAAVKLSQELEKISSLKAQSNIISKEIHSIDIDPSCPYQLAFHLDDGWSGVLDTNKFQLTHIHCPPPSWLDEPNDLANLSSLRKPCWLPMNSIYIVGSSSSNGIYLLDFYPDSTSPCHVKYNEDIKNMEESDCQQEKNRFLPLSESVTACVAHPLNGTIVAGTKLSSLLVISQ
ncbi:transducin/WD40 repeat-like superfamily protein [Striga asiatica]|uniref:Transducin/WD40 repeat-like superfamily protein n=1 Tax=Striga asiatica TaxID=4170 RepID=A0A5A7Q836_STRAF|nr:transducin/WD40 repeat-like superfamily protein [Striga asiatica]